MRLDGLLVIDKPGRVTSRDVVNRAIGWFPRRTRIGHAGTLDPLATGVLVLCVGSATRLIDYVQRMSKVYRAGVILGATSDTDDADGVITPMADPKAPSRDELERELAAFIGTIEQVPPAYSAAKVTGRRAYDLARKGKEFELSPRPVTITRIDVIAYDFPRLEILVHCGKGTYIRSLARDLGTRLGCGGYIASLRRLSIGSFTVENAFAMDAEPAAVRGQLLPLKSALHSMPSITLADPDVIRLMQGQRIAVGGNVNHEVMVVDERDELVAVGNVVEGVLISSKVLAPRS